MFFKTKKEINMIKVVFKNLEKSQLAIDIVTEKIELFMEKFPDLKDHKVHLFLSMENSFFKKGRDVFSIKAVIDGKKYGGIVIQKKDINLYAALDELTLVLLESLNRKGDKKRVKTRNNSRKYKMAIAS